jgi:4-hydroxybenzoate polyprenyltransferase
LKNLQVNSPDFETQTSSAEIIFGPEVNHPFLVPSVFILIEMKHLSMVILRPQRLLYGLHTLWLFTASDAHTFIPSQAIFGLVSALSGPLLTTMPETAHLNDVLHRIPWVFMYLWLNVLLFNIANQRLPESILEDSINKPWRPLPSHRLTPEQARYTLRLIIPVIAMFSIYTGGIKQTVVHMVLTWMYNDLGGAMHAFGKNIYNVLGLICYGSGATAVVCGNKLRGSHSLNPLGWMWITILSTVVLTTIHLQDLRDRKGDESAGRKTLPVVLGDLPSRWLLAAGIAISSLGCPIFWATNGFAYVMVAAMGGLLAWRILAYRNELADRVSWKLWPLWMMSIYIIPVLPRANGVSVFYR